MSSPGRNRSVSDDKLLSQMLLYPAPALTASMLAEVVEMSRQGTDKRLRDMEESGFVQSHKGGGTRLWWLTAEGHELARASISQS